MWSKYVDDAILLQCVLPKVGRGLLEGFHWGEVGIKCLLAEECVDEVLKSMVLLLDVLMTKGFRMVR